MPETNPCLSCGACCAGFRVSFYWAEGDDAEGGFVPTALTNQLTAHLRCMKGTDASAPRCVCLEGVVGEQVHCTIYAHRPTPCREFTFHGEHGEDNARCNTVRAKHNLPPLVR